MGLFGDFGKVFTRAVTAVATGGVSEVARAVAPSTRSTFDAIGNVLAPTSLSGVAGIGLAAATKNPSFIAGGISTGLSHSMSTAPITGFAGGSPMALNIGGLLGQVGGIFSGAGQPQAFQTIGNIASLASGFFPAQQPMMAVPMIQPTMAAAMPQIVTRGGAMMARMLTKEVFDAGAKVLMRLGIGFPATTSGFTSALKRSLSSIASLARRTPSGTMVSILIGLGLTALEANMLTAWHAQRKKGRRMNAANPRALHRAARRIKSFHKMCSTIDLLKSRGRRVGTSSRCGSCKKSPCRC